MINVEDHAAHRRKARKGNNDHVYFHKIFGKKLSDTNERQHDERSEIIPGGEKRKKQPIKKRPYE